MKLLRTIRLDPSDSFVFPRAAEPGEWAVTGSFLFWGRDPATLTGKERAAFRAGFVGVDSLGFSTLVVAQPIHPEERRAAVDAYEKQILSDTMARCRFNQKVAAEALGLSYDQIRHALKKHGLNP